MFFLTKHIARNRIDINDCFNLRILYIEFRRYLLRLDFNMLTWNLANVGSWGGKLIRGPNSSRFVGITYSYVELLL